MSSVQLKHLACIMDGNRRYAKSQGLPSFMGHKEGIATVKRVVDFCLKEHIAYLSLYAFSLENINRSMEEKTYLFDLIVEGVNGYIADIIAANVRVIFVGDRQQFPAHVMDVITSIERATAECTSLHVHILFYYGGRQEIVAAVKQLVADGTMAADAISVDTLKKYMWTGNVPEPELVIRTGGARRLSNFLLFQTAYSELYFTDMYWPALQEKDLYDALAYYAATQRNFGS